MHISTSHSTSWPWQCWKATWSSWSLLWTQRPSTWPLLVVLLGTSLHLPFSSSRRQSRHLHIWPIYDNGSLGRYQACLPRIRQTSQHVLEWLVVSGCSHPQVADSYLEWHVESSHLFNQGHLFIIIGYRLKLKCFYFFCLNSSLHIVDSLGLEGPPLHLRA